MFVSVTRVWLCLKGLCNAKSLHFHTAGNLKRHPLQIEVAHKVKKGYLNDKIFISPRNNAMSEWFLFSIYRGTYLPLQTLALKGSYALNPISVNKAPNYFMWNLTSFHLKAFTVLMPGVPKWLSRVCWILLANHFETACPPKGNRESEQTAHVWKLKAISSTADLRTCKLFRSRVVNESREGKKNYY